MSAGAILAIAILSTGILMMRFRKRWLAKINIAVTNRITSLFAGWLPGFGILTHVGRKSGKVYRTPVNVFRASNGFIIALTYSSQSEWVKIQTRSDLDSNRIAYYGLSWGAALGPIFSATEPR